MFELLTKYIGVLNDENSGEWIIDQTHKGTMDDPKQFPFVAFSRLTENFINEADCKNKLNFFSPKSIWRPRPRAEGALAPSCWLQSTVGAGGQGRQPERLP